MRPAQRTGTTHPARSADHCAKNPQQYLELNTSHHIIIPSSKTHPQSQTPSTPQYLPPILTHSHLQPKLLVLFKSIEIVIVKRTPTPY